MSEDAVAKTTRKIVSAMTRYQLFHQATIYLDEANDAVTNLRIINRLKRLIKEDNKDKFIMYFISRSPDFETTDDGLIIAHPYITFRSNCRIYGARILKEQEKSGGAFRVVGRGKEYISTNLEKRYNGTIDKIKKVKSLILI